MSTELAPPAFKLPAALVAEGYSLRPETEDDVAFLLALYASTREDELALAPWSAEQKIAFLNSQFAAQHHHYRTYIADCAFDVIAHHGVPVGRLYLEVRPARLHIVDIALLPEYRNKGVGKTILEGLMAAARAGNRGIGLMVETFNPAMRLYRRLGFVDIADHGVHLEMEWKPQEAAAVS